MPLLLALEATTGLPTDCLFQRETFLGYVVVPYYPRNEQVPVTECPLKPCARSRFSWHVCSLSAVKEGGDFISTSYLLCPDNPLQYAGLPVPQLWILYFLVTVHFTAFNSTFQPSSTLSLLWWYICNSFSHSLQANLIKTNHHKDIKQHHKTVNS